MMFDNFVKSNTSLISECATKLASIYENTNSADSLIGILTLMKKNENIGGLIFLSKWTKKINAKPFAEAKDYIFLIFADILRNCEECNKLCLEGCEDEPILCWVSVICGMLNCVSKMM